MPTILLISLMAESFSFMSLGKDAVSELVSPPVLSNGFLPTVRASVPESLCGSSVEGIDSSSKEAVENQKKETQNSIDFWACGTTLYRHPPPLNHIFTLEEIEEEERYRDPLFWMYPDDDDDYIYDLPEGIDSD